MKWPKLGKHDIARKANNFLHFLYMHIIRGKIYMQKLYFAMNCIMQLFFIALNFNSAKVMSLYIKMSRLFSFTDLN